MSPPIPEPMVEPRMVERGPRPQAMKYFMAGSILITITNFIVNSSLSAARNNIDAFSEVDYLILYFLIQAIWVTLLWLLWKGRNGARIIIMLVCMVTLTNLLSIGDLTLPQKAVTIADVAFSAVFFWWLCTPEVVAFTKGKPA